MPTHEPGDRLFDEAEIGRILQRAAELQGRRVQTPTTGLSLSELKSLASESGLDPALVATAVAELQIESAGRQDTWWGGPVHHEADIVLPGPVSDDTWERMLDAVRSGIGQIGRVEARGTTREWIVDKKDDTSGRFTVREESDGTSRLRVHWHSPVPAILAFIATGVLSLMALPLVFDEFALGVFPGIPAYLAIVATLFFAFRFLVSQQTGRQRERLQQLVQTLSAIGADGMTAAIHAEQSPSGTGSTLLPGEDTRIRPDDREDSDASTRERGRDRQRT